MALSAPFPSVLIANRGEIAVRIARTAKAMGMRTIGVYSDADAGAPHTRICDAAVRIGPPPPRESYLRGDVIIAAALGCGAAAIHPGYGFLAENAVFAQACADAGLVFVGPPPSAMRAVGDKISAKQTVAGVGVPIIEGSLGNQRSKTSLRAQAQKLGFPLLIKAAAGGGGKGMRVVTDSKDFDAALDGARREAAAAFGDDTVFVERYLPAPRHIEVQVLADSFGSCIHLGERECSVQRRHQKILEEAPSTAVSPQLRADMGQAAIRASAAAGYVNAGTVEFMLDGEGRYYFLEMNARLQVEHAVSEALSGVDLVREQFEIAAGRPLRLTQQSVAPRGHAIEVRIFAEDAAKDFLPSVGTVGAFVAPQGPGIRNDVGIETGSVLTGDYDPMLAKLIVFDRTRAECIERLRAALDDYMVAGVITNLPLLRWLVRDPAFVAGKTTTAFLSERFRPEELMAGAQPSDAMLAAAGAMQYEQHSAVGGPWQRLGPWRSAAEQRELRLSAPAAAVARLDREPGGAWRCSLGDLSGSVTRQVDGSFILDDGLSRRRFAAATTAYGMHVCLGSCSIEVRPAPPPSAAHSDASLGSADSADGIVTAPMSGKIVKVNVAPGERVDARAVIIVMEAMKMEHSVAAPFAGVATVHVKAGDSVAAGDEIAKIKSSE